MAELMVVPVSTSVLTPADTWETIISSCVGTVHPGDVICLTGEAAAITQNRYIRPEEMQPGFLERFFFRLLPEDDPFSNLYIMASAMETAGKWKNLIWHILGRLCALAGYEDIFFIHCPEADFSSAVAESMPPYDKCIIYRPLGVKKLCEEIAARTGAYGAVIVETREWKKVTILGISRKVSARKAAHILAKAPFSSGKQHIPMAIIRNYVQG